MATPRIYNHLQKKLSRFFWGFSVLNIVFVVLSAVCLLQAPKESDGLPKEAISFIAFGVAAIVMMVLSMISRYQQESRIRLIPIVGRLHKALISKPTPWGEAVRINIMVLVCLLMVGFLIVLVGMF